MHERLLCIKVRTVAFVLSETPNLMLETVCIFPTAIVRKVEAQMSIFLISLFCLSGLLTGRNLKLVYAEYVTPQGCKLER